MTPGTAKLDDETGVGEPAGGARAHASAGSGERGRDLLLPLAAIVVALLIFFLGGSTYLYTILTQVAVAACVVLGLNVLVGYTGVVSLGNIIFYGLGAYITSVGSVQWHLPVLVAGLLGVIAASAVGVVIGYPALRLSGGYLTLVTFAGALAFYALVENSTIFNGETGIGGIPPMGIGAAAATSYGAKFILSWAVCLVLAVLGWRLRRRRFGRSLRSISGDEIAATSLGVSAARYKMQAFVISAAFAGVGGVLMATTINYVNPDAFDLNTTFSFFTMLFFGGIGTVWGGIIGAGIGIGLQQWLTTQGTLTTLQPTLFAVVLIAILIVRPKGLLAPLSREELDGLRARSARWRRSGDRR